MTSPRPDVAASYELRIGGHLDLHWSTWFDGFTITHQDDGTTTLRGVVRDQSDLHGLLAKVRDLGTTLISVTHLETPDSDSDDGADSREQQHRQVKGADAADVTPWARSKHSRDNHRPSRSTGETNGCPHTDSTRDGDRSVTGVCT